MKGETLFLKVVVFLIGIPVLAICIFWLPGLTSELAKMYPEWIYSQYPVLIGLYVTALAYFFALYQTLQLLSYIDEDKAFSELSVKALKNIKNSAITISILYIGLIPFLIPIAEADDAPGVVGFPIIIVFASAVVAVFAAILQKLLKNAIALKSENDLTV